MEIELHVTKATLEHPKDICECGDYRYQHKANIGACNLNGLGHGLPFGLGKCMQFRLAISIYPTYDPYDHLYGVED